MKQDIKSKPKSTLPRLVDTHCHLEMEQFDADREDVIARAFNAGLEAMITIASDVPSNRQALEIAKTHDRIFCSVGLHPHDAKDFTEDFYQEIKSLAGEEKVVAVGEIGLDYHYDHSPRPVQREVFARQLALAKETGLPAIIHSREADADTITIMKESAITRGVLHCFSGSMELLRTALEMGLHISVAGPVTFKKAAELQEAVRHIPDDLLLVETDAPYLAPVPFRGKRNEPAYVEHTARAVAALLSVTFEDIARITTLNAHRLFGIGSVSGEGAVTYQIRNSLYLNVTNRCTNQCSFCVRSYSDFVKGHNLRLSHEPTLEELKNEIGDPTRYSEIVFCGYGEPTLRLDLIKELSGWIKERGGRVRVNTNGHANLIHKRNVLPELQGLVDVYSVSLDAQDQDTYDRLCRPALPGAFEAVKDFIREAKQYAQRVQATVVDLEGVDVEKCQELARSLGVELRVRKLNAVG